MNLLRELMNAMLVEGKPAIAAAQERDLTSDLFPGQDGEALRFIYQYFRDYNAVPPAALVNQRVGYSLEQALGTPPTAVSKYWIDQLVQIRLKIKLSEGGEALAVALEQSDSTAAMQALESTLKEVRKLNSERAKVVSLPKKMIEVLEFHDRIAAGLRGIETPWESLNRMTYGFSASDFVVFVARLGLGKTWMLLILAMHAWSMGKRVLIASTEMDQLRMSLRTLALHLKLPPDMLRRGRLGEARTAVQEAIQKMEDSPGLYMVGGGNYRLGFDSVEAAVEEVEPDIVLMDGAYLLTSPAGKDKPKNAGRFDKAADTFEECKQFNLRIGLPVVTTTQFNRSARRNSLAGAEVENIALSDTIGWAADYIFAQLQTDEMKDAKEMIIKPLKVREGSGWEFMLRWDIDGSDFREIPHTRREGAKAAAGTGGAGAAPIGDSLGGSNPFAKPPPSSASSTDHKF